MTSLRGIGVMAFVALVVVSVAIAWMHPQVSFKGQIYSSSDAQSAAAFQSLDTGDEFPHWNPFVFAGMPSYASLAHNPGTYPLTAPIRVVRDALGLAPMFWLLVHLALAGLATTGWVRWRGESWAVAIAAGCWVVALPKLAAWGAYGHGTKLGSFAWLPLVGWCTEAVLRRGSTAWASGLAFAMGMMLLRGHVQIAYYAVMLVGALVLASLIATGKDPVQRMVVLRRTGLIASAGLVALAVSLVLYLPVLEYQGHSIRGAAGTGGGAAFDYATNWSLSWPEFATQWWPTTAGYGRGAYVGQMPFTDYPNYIGLPLLLLAVAGALHRRDRFSWALVGLIAVATLLALGRNFFVYRLFYELLPGFKKFRVPVMILALQQIAIILLAARGLDAIVVGRIRLPRVVLAVVGMLGLLGILAGSIVAGPVRDAVVESLESMARGFGRPVPPASALMEVARIATADALRLGAVLLASVLVVFAAQSRRIPTTAALALVGLLVFVDLWRVDQPLLHPDGRLSQVGRGESGLVAVPSSSLLADRDALVEYTEESSLARWLKQQDPRPRVLPLGGFEVDNRLAAQGIVSLGGYHAAKLKLYEDMRSRIYDRSAPRLSLARLFAAHWVVVPGPLPERTLAALAQLGLEVQAEPAWSGEEGFVYAIVDPVERVRIVSNVSAESRGQDTTDREPDPAVLDRILAPGFDPLREAILSAPAEPSPAAGAERGSVELLAEGYNHWSVRVQLPAPGVLVTADPWYPGWTVRVDGEPRPLLRANYAQRAVALEAGVHEVEFRYAAHSYVTGKRIAGLGWLIILAGFAVPLVQRSRRARTPRAEQV